ncbi:hypothetical protein [Stutzerimonas nitrititolerans]|uniref:hypothetical protein n=1 Tax=Stutzerimonas nitrititolerans TaxID=2482751 RepID=UPI002897B2E0|nr:hypothetical protein [Stutzerimonas nitrititolerans]
MKKLLILAFLAITGCGVMPPKTVFIDGARNQSRENLVTLGEGIRGQGHITHIDGKVIFPYGFAEPSMGIILNPGQYSLTMLYYEHGYGYQKTSEAKITANLEAGHSYSPAVKVISQSALQFHLIDHGKNYPIECLSNSKFHKKPDKC